jgi:hypothetical protein
MNFKEFVGVCPFCSVENFFKLTGEELDNDFHFSCTFCESEVELSKWRLEEIVGVRK